MTKKTCLKIDPRAAKEILRHLERTGVSHFVLADGEQTIGYFVTTEKFNIMSERLGLLDNPEVAGKAVKVARIDVRGKTLSLENAFGK